jgi:hypothetical protein
MTKASDNVFPRFLISEGGSTATPAADEVTVYAKADGLLYSKDDAGVETLVSGGAGGGGLSNQGLATYLDFDGAAAPADPTGDHGRIYAKTDGRIYSRDAGGVEYGPFDAASGGLIAASSDDFAAGTLDEKWTQLGGSLLDVLNTTDTSGQLHMSKTSIGYAVCGIYETAPTPPFVVVAKLASWTLANNFVQAGIMLLDSAPTALRTFGPLYGGYAPAVNDMAFGLWSSRTARASNLDINIVSTAPLWLALVVPTTLLVVPLYSTDGPTWISTPTPATSGLTIAKVGLFVAGNTGGGDVAAYFEWIKCWSLPAFTA